MIEYEIKYSDRKTMAIYILRDGRVEVRCNFKTNPKQIAEFVKIKEKWILKHVGNMKLAEKKSITVGSTMLFLGKEYIIKESSDKIGLCENEFYVPDGADDDEILKLLIAFYKEKAHEIIIKRLHDWEEVMGLYAVKAGITSAKTQWGSCSGKNSINFTWRLVMADEDTIDYVIIHELAHIKEKNHGKRFWQTVGQYYSNIPSAKLKLKNLRSFERLWE